MCLLRMKTPFLAAALTAFLGSAALADALPASASIRLSVSTSAGKGAEEALVFLLPISDQPPGQAAGWTAKSADEGSKGSKGEFRLSVEGPGFYVLWVLEPRHETLYLPVWVEAGADILVQAQLGERAYAETSEPVLLVGDWDEFGAFHHAQPTGGGCYSFESSTANPTSLVQVFGLGIWGREGIPPPQSEAFGFLPGRGYLSRVPSPEGKLALRFCVPSTKAPRATVRFAAPHEEQGRVFDAIDGFRRWNTQRLQWLRGKGRGAEDPALSTSVESGQEAVAKEFRALLSSKKASTRAVAGVLLINTLMNVDAETAKLIREAASPTSPAWGAALLSTGLGGHLGSRQGSRDALAAIAKQNPDRHLRALALLGLAHHAWAGGERSALASLSSRLEEDFADIPAVDHWLRHSRPSSVDAGQAAPRFLIPRPKPSDALSNDDLLGQKVLLELWSTTCTPCLPKLLATREAAPTFRERNIRLLSLALDADVLELEDLALACPLGEVLEVGNEDSRKIATAFDLRSVPTYFLLDEKGKILARIDPSQAISWPQILTEALGPPATLAPPSAAPAPQ